MKHVVVSEQPATGEVKINLADFPHWSGALASLPGAHLDKGLEMMLMPFWPI
jgi:hypothetical protein